MEKFIDLKAEKLLAHNNIRKYYPPKNRFIHHMQIYPNDERLAVVDELCELYHFDRQLYEMIDEAYEEEQAHRYGYEYKSIYRNG